MDSRIRVATCKTGNKRLLDEVFESKPIKEGGKIPLGQHKKSLKFSKKLHKQYVFPKCKQQLYHGTHISEPIYIKKIKQYGSSSSYEKRKRGLEKNIPQDIERNGGDD